MRFERVCFLTLPSFPSLIAAGPPEDPQKSGIEVITATLNARETVTFTHTIQATLQTNEAKDIIVHLDEPMVKAIKDLLGKDNAIAGAKAIGSAVEKGFGVKPHRFVKRVPPGDGNRPVLAQLPARPPQFEPIVREVLRQMGVNDRFTALVLRAFGVPAVMARLQAGLQDRLASLYAYAESLQQLTWVRCRYATPYSS